MQGFFSNLLGLSLEAAPWLVIGLLATAVIRAFVPDAVMKRWIGGKGFGSVLRASLVGAPLPLCSCGVIPAAVGLKRQGASPGATASFLVATPETGVDSIAISYAMLGPFLTVVRPVAAVVSGIATGMAVQAVAMKRAVSRVVPGMAASASWGGVLHAEPRLSEAKPGIRLPARAEPSPASLRSAAAFPQESGGDACCGSESGGGDCCDGEAVEAGASWKTRLGEGVKFATTQLLDDIAVWIVVGLVIAAVMVSVFEPSSLAELGSGPVAMAVMAVVGMPMYVCSTGATPLAAGLLLAGVSPGTVLVFLLAGPATNVATIGVVKRELGYAAAGTYLASIGAVSIAIGLATDAVASAWSIDAVAQAEASGRVIPVGVAWACLAALVLLAIRPLRRRLLW